MDPASFPYPLDVYARVLQLEFGQLRQLGFPLQGEREDESLELMLQRFADMLFEEIPATSQRILVHGATLSSVACDLARSGHQVVLLTALPMTIENTPASMTCRVGAPADLTGEMPFDWIIQQGSVCYAELLAWMSAARLLLSEGGQLIWSGEFTNPVAEQRFSALPLLLTFERLAARLGLQITGRRNLTPRVPAGLQAITALMEKHRAALLSASAVSQGQFDGAMTHIQAMESGFTTGRQSLWLFTLQCPQGSQTPGVEFGAIDSFTTAEIAPLFEASFGHPFNTALWQWKYGAGRGRSLVARKQGRLVAHYGGAPRHIEYFGGPNHAIQICDVMVLPGERSHFGSESLFFKTAATFLEREIGFTVEHLLGFGFPNLKAMHIATRLGLYEKTDDFVEVFLPRNLEFPPSAACEMRELKPQDAAVVDQLWQSMKARLTQGIVGRRDWSYIDYRYFQHPFADYQRLLIYRDGNAIAVAVLRSHQDCYLLMDLLCEQTDIPLALAALHQHFSPHHASAGIKCWITRGWHQVFLLDGALVNELQIEIPCHSWTPGPSAEQLYGKWWLTAGDMDFL